MSVPLPPCCSAQPKPAVSRQAAQLTSHGTRIAPKNATSRSVPTPTTSANRRARAHPTADHRPTRESFATFAAAAQAITVAPSASSASRSQNAIASQAGSGPAELANISSYGGNAPALHDELPSTQGSQSPQGSQSKAELPGLTSATQTPVPPATANTAREPQPGAVQTPPVTETAGPGAPQPTQMQASPIAPQSIPSGSSNGASQPTQTQASPIAPQSIPSGSGNDAPQTTATQASRPCVGDKPQALLTPPKPQPTSSAAPPTSQAQPRAQQLPTSTPSGTLRADTNETVSPHATQLTAKLTAVQAKTASTQAGAQPVPQPPSPQTTTHPGQPTLAPTTASTQPGTQSMARQTPSQPTSTPTPPETPTDPAGTAQPPQWLSVTQPMTSTGDGSTRIALRLEEPGLGVIRASLVSRNTQMAVRLYAYNDATHTAIEQALGRLHNEISSLASQPDHAQVELMGHHDLQGRSFGNRGSTPPQQTTDRRVQDTQAGMELQHVLAATNLVDITL